MVLPPPAPIEITIEEPGPTSPFTCTPYGNVINRATSLTTDFSRILILDMNMKAVFAGWSWGISCTLSHSSPCAGAAVVPEGVIGGGIDGYLSKVFTDDAFGMGTPANRVYWAVKNSNTTQINIDPLTYSEFWQATALKGLPIIIHYRNNTFSTNIVASNTTTRITVTTPIDDDLINTIDYILIAPMTCGIMFGEKRTTLPSSFLAVLADIFDSQPTPQTFTFDIFAGAGQRDTLDMTSGPAVSLEVDSEELAQGQGDVNLPQHAAKSLSLGMHFQPYGSGEIQIGPISITQFLCPGEKVRSEEK